MMDALIRWLSGPPLVDGICPVVDQDACEGWQCVDLTRVWAMSFVFHSIAFVVSWWISHKLSKPFRELNLEMKIYWASCVVSGLHAAITAQGSVRWTLLNNDFNDGNYFRPVPEQDFYSAVSSAYFAYDLVLHIIFAAMGMARFRVPEMFLHHILGVICFTAAPNYPLSWTAGMWLSTELSGPFANARFVLQYGGFRHTPLYVANGLMMVLTFLVIRLGIPATFWYIFYLRLDEFTSLVDNWILALFVFSGLTGTVLNIMWTRLILKGFIGVAFGKGEKKETNGKKTE
ncbi:hypothetical protein PTSG_13090 [Salpingoeca rosetta]|uniref:TLC domain-containing protein n=1 Tax=Salpingoeca rosetta (strain ATCC 50818 / BSB-021) TaxID=946362 RepID=F2UQ66_SALR5|nr:uncharacterized protein PTSG_13090 [Salpingoeca rosetta]EGD79734.1 hypothetical protein PTSG_13090 [Salpingoeca rosetta]|eukprot:XP_004988683.1 hypothetical protein PTSG_13090 [Salpingoeca rosetta]